MKPSIVQKIITILKVNPCSNFFRGVRNMSNLENYKIQIRLNVNLDQRVYNFPSKLEVAVIWIENNELDNNFCQNKISKEILVYTHYGHIIKYKLQIREHNQSILLHGDRLLQQYIVDMYIKLETSRLDFFRNKQHEIRVILYQEIVDSVHTGETQSNKVGRQIVLPASFIGEHKNICKRYMNAMASVQRFGKPKTLNLLYIYSHSW